MTLFDLQSFPQVRTPAVQSALALFANSPASERGAIFTRPEVVEFMLDLLGYTSDQDLTQLRVLEPSFGEGEFLLAIINRLLTAFREHGGTPERAGERLSRCLVGVELHCGTWERTAQRVHACLLSFDIPEAQCEYLVQQWLRQDDFLLTEVEGTFDIVVSNPPYLRQEAVPAALMAAYRERYTTIYDRADLYVPFFERGLDLLTEGGKLCFICSDRWLRNRYGGPLRKKVAGEYHVAAYVDMVGVAAFHTEVTAYPAITLIVREHGEDTRLTLQPETHPEHLKRLARALRGEEAHPAVETVPGAVQGADPWLLDLGRP